MYSSESVAVALRCVRLLEIFISYYIILINSTF
jgi:hypothetical protein